MLRFVFLILLFEPLSFSIFSLSGMLQYIVAALLALGAYGYYSLTKRNEVSFDLGYV